MVPRSLHCVPQRRRHCGPSSSVGRRQEKAYTEVAECTEFTEKRNPRETQERPKTQAQTPCLGHPPPWWRERRRVKSERVKEGKSLELGVGGLAEPVEVGPENGPGLAGLAADEDVGVIADGGVFNAKWLCEMACKLAGDKDAIGVGAQETDGDYDLRRRVAVAVEPVGV